MPGPVRETTEWEDVQRRFGNLPPAELVVDDEALGILVDEAADQHQEARYEAMSVDELAALADRAEDQADDEDMAFFDEYRRRRMEEMAGRVQHGSVVDLRSRSEFEHQVTLASTSAPVVVHLYGDRLPASELMDAALAILARKFPHVKFVRIRSTVCIPGYPNANLPTLVVYDGGAAKRTLAGLATFGGLRMTPDDVEWELAQCGVLRTDLEENPHTTISDRIFVNIQRK